MGVAPDVEARIPTRQRILQAAITSLAARGLAGTSTLQIQQDAGVSRGSLLHHFPSKQQLLVAAVQHLAEERFGALRSEVMPEAGVARVAAAIERLWLTHEGELFWAAMELWLGARSDPQLRAALEFDERRLGRVIRGLCDDLFGPELAARPGYPTLRACLVSSMRGVALTRAFDPRPMKSEPHLMAWTQLAMRELEVGPVGAEYMAEFDG